MELPFFVTTDGRQLHKAETSRHHVLWRRDWYPHPTERKFREMSGFVLRMTIGAHQELHAAIEPPHKPNQDLMRDIYHFGRNIPSCDPYELFETITDHLWVITDSDTPNSLDASRLAESFVAQQVYIDYGKVRLER